LPSLPYVHREFEDQQNGGWGSALLPDIPVTSIGYGHAQKLFARMNGPPVQVKNINLINNKINIGNDNIILIK
jgi:hypothetical protein